MGICENYEIEQENEYRRRYKVRLVQRGLTEELAAASADCADYCGESPEEAESHADDEISYMMADHDPGSD